MLNFRLVRHLWLFLAVAEERSFARAAKRLGMSQPPLTEQIQVLEQALKAKLFERLPRGVRLTPAGLAILPTVRKFAEQVERLEQSVREAVSGRVDVLRVGAVSTALLDVAPKVLDALRHTRPDLSITIVEMDSADTIEALMSGDIDLGFARLDGDSSFGPVKSIALRWDRLAVALHGEHPLAGKKSIPLAALVNEDFAFFARRHSPSFYDQIVSACKAAGFLPRTPFEVNSIVAQVAFVSCGQGIALVPAGYRRLAPANIVVRPLKESIKLATTAIAWNSERETELVRNAVELAMLLRQAAPASSKAPQRNS